MKKYNGFKSLENTISSVIAPILKKKKSNFIIINNLFKNWQNIIGDKYHKFCIPEKIKFPKGKKIDATLYIKAYNPSIAFFIEANSNNIIEEIARYYGYKIISKIIIHQELRNIELETKPENDIKINQDTQKLIDDTTREIKDQNLRSTLNKLGISILKQQ